MVRRIRAAALAAAIVLPALAPGFASGLASPASAAAAGFSYGSISVTPGSSEALITYRTIDERQSQVCDLATFICDPAASSTAPAVNGEIAAGGYTLSPSGKVAFVAESDASGNPVNRVYQVANGSLVNPLTLPVTAPVRRILFTPDDARAAVRTSTALLSLDLRTGAVLGVASWDAEDYFSFAQVSPDARYVAYFSPATGEGRDRERRFRIADLRQGKIYTLAETVKYWDLLSEENMLFQFSPDGTYLLYKDDRDGQPTLYRVDLARMKGATFKGVRLFTRSYSVADFMLTDANTVLYVANRANALRWDLFSYDIRKNVLATVAESVAYYPPLKRAGEVVLFNRLVPWGSEVAAYDVSTRTVRTFAAPANRPGSSAALARIATGTPVKFPGGAQGALFLPDNYDSKKAYPLLVWLHGGPHRQTSLGYHPYASYGVYDWMLDGLRASGVIVLKLDYRGSYGYGRPFAESLMGGVGVKDMADVFAATADLKAKRRISQTYLMGVSYGGYLALKSLVERPSAFAGVISVNGVTDWLTLVNRNPDTIFAADFDGPLDVRNELLYDRASIIAKTANLGVQKVVLLHSRNDTSVSYSQSEMYAGILRSAGKNVEFTTIPDDDHVFTKRASAVTVCETMFRTLGIAPGERCAL